ncbi:reverse transcriptase domain-containing protein [Tanacetum coccineum]
MLHLSRRLRQYFEAHPIKVITDQPIKQILDKLEVSGKLAKYAVELGAYNIVYVPRNAIKRQVLADFLNETPVGTKHMEIYSLVNEDANLEEWTIYTDGASSLKGVGAGLVLVDPAGVEYTYAIHLNFPSTNNEAEYEALLTDSKLVACQLNREFVTSSEGITKYLTKAREHVALFKKFSIQNIPRKQNQKADVLSKLASVTFNHLTKEILVEVLNAKFVGAKEISTIVEEEGDNLMTPIVKCLEKGIWPKDEKEARNLRMKISQYVMEEGVLFKKSYLAPMLKCVGPLQANYVIREVHEGAYRMHSGPRVIVTDNETQLVNDPFKSWCEKLKIKQMHTAVAHPQDNGLVERANKSLMHGLKARLGRERVGWVDELPNLL